MVTVFSLDNTPPVAANNSRLGHIDSIPIPVLDLWWLSHEKAIQREGVLQSLEPLLFRVVAMLRYP